MAKKTNTGITKKTVTKKKRPLTKKQRRERSLKGWETRRLVTGLKDTAKATIKVHRKERELEALQKEVKAAKLELQEQKDANARLARKTAEIEELWRQLQAKEDYAKQAAERAEFDLQFKNFVRGEEIQWLHRDGSNASHPTILRHLEETDSLLERLKAANELGADKLNDEIYKIAKEYDVMPKEVYTLWESP
jgi:vacuolar-type H+-ATPase subunit I/STV1